MSYKELRNTLVIRLDQADRGDRGWQIVTRHKISINWVLNFIMYIEQRAGEDSYKLTEVDYSRLGTIIASRASDPQNSLKRHHLLLLDHPLGLINRVNGNSWQQIKLTESGLRIANCDDLHMEFEKILLNIHFAKEPWFSKRRVEEYSSFDINVYSATLHVLKHVDGLIDSDEFNLFLSRVRTFGETDWAINCIKKYRKLNNSDKMALKIEVNNRIPSVDNKKDGLIANWESMGPHTFSLFSLGQSMLYHDKTLYLTEMWSNIRDSSTLHLPSSFNHRLGILNSSLPQLSNLDELLAPPTKPAYNDGTDAEMYVAKVFKSLGWHVAFYTDRRGFGFDLWICKSNSPMFIEVKSSVNLIDSINLTHIEYEAARKYGERYILVLVENVGSDVQDIQFLQNPAKSVKIVKRKTRAYSISRSQWLNAVGDQRSS